MTMAEAPARSRATKLVTQRTALRALKDILDLYDAGMIFPTYVYGREERRVIDEKIATARETLRRGGMAL